MRLGLILVAGGLLAVGLTVSAADKGDTKVPAALNFKMNDIAGQPVELANIRARSSCW